MPSTAVSPPCRCSLSGCSGLLFGGELAFAYQNISRFAEERESLRISYDHRRQVTLAVMLHVARIFRDGHGPVSAVEIHTALRLPTRIVNDVLFSLVTARLLVAVRSESDDRETLFSPAVDIHALTLYDVLEQVESHGDSALDFRDSPEMKVVGELLADIRAAARRSQANVLLIDI